MATEKTVLVVDDEAMIRESVSAYITKQGYHVITADNGREALEIFQEKRSARRSASSPEYPSSC